MDTLTQLELPISDTIDDRAWQQSQGYSTPKAQWTAYINQVCVDTVLPWLQAEYAPSATLSLDARDLVNGCAIAWNEKRLVLIPDYYFDTSELRIPAEWIEIPSWIGDYYLAVQVNPDESLMRVWGYTTHEQINAIGQYDSDDRTYCLDAQALVQDVAVLWIVQQYPQESTRAQVAELPTVLATQAENLLQRLASIEQPRLEIPFTLWGSLLQTRSWRERLQQLRQGRSSNRQIVTDLRQWFENSFNTSWQAIEAWLNPEELAFSFRQSSAIEPASIRRVKRLIVADLPILLVLAITPESNDRVGIRVQVRPIERSGCLPSNLTLSLIAASGEVVQSTQAREQDNLIQLQRFKSPAGTQFNVQIALDDTVFVEVFQC